MLGRFVPEFGQIVAMTEFSRYHHFTVDEHLLRAVGFVSELEHGRLGEDHPLSHEIFPTLENRRVLYVATFLHDIAKGRPEDHSIAGAQVARELCPRFGLSKPETATVAWLIEHHLVMSEVAQRRDLFDPKTISDFAELVQSPERLKLLLVLTVADIRAVGPGVWNGWKGELLRTLYHETEPVLSGGHTAGGRAQRATAAREEFAKAMTAWSPEEVGRHTSRLNDPYWLTTDLKLQVAHAKLIDKAQAQNALFSASHDTDAFRGVTRIIVYMPDHPHLLATIAGACAISGADIVDAQIATTSDGWALDTVVLRRDFDSADETRRAGRIAETIERALRGELQLPEAVERKAAPLRQNDPFDVEPQIAISNSLSDHSTVIEIACHDRPGLLYDITRALRELNLNIRSAHIATFGERRGRCVLCAGSVRPPNPQCGTNGTDSHGAVSRARPRGPGRERNRRRSGQHRRAGRRAGMNLVRSALTVGSLTAASRLLGFVRDILIAAALGTGAVADAFFVAFRFPNLFRRLFAEGAFNAAFVPLFSGRLQSQGPDTARSFAGEAASVLLWALIVFTAVCELAMPLIAYVIAPGFSDTPDKFDLTILLTRIAFPYLAFMSLVALVSGVLNALGRFTAAAAAPILLNLVLITTLLRDRSARSRWAVRRRRDARLGRLPCRRATAFNGLDCGISGGLRPAPSTTTTDTRRKTSDFPRDSGNHCRRSHPDQHRDRHDHRVISGRCGILSLLRRPRLSVAAWPWSASPWALCSCLTFPGGWPPAMIKARSLHRTAPASCRCCSPYPRRSRS